MTDREKTVAALDKALVQMHGCGRYTPEDVDELETAAWGALELLKEQEPRVLTTEELFHMEHKGVYLERRNSRLYPTEPSIVLRTEVCMPSLGGKKYVLMRENKLSDPHWAYVYNKAINNGWRCWTAKPTDEQRKAVKWDD